MGASLSSANIVPKLANLHISNANIVVDASKAEVARIFASNSAGTPLTHNDHKAVYRMYDYTGEVTLTGSALGN